MKQERRSQGNLGQSTPAGGTCMKRRKARNAGRLAPKAHNVVA
jgi:hypothetical protein